MKREGSLSRGGTTLKKTETVYLTATEGKQSRLSSNEQYEANVGRLIFQSQDNGVPRNADRS